MKRLGLILAGIWAFAATVCAQKYALVDMEYILKNVPAYERACEQLNQVSRKWQAEVELLEEESRTLYNAYQAESMFLSDEQRTKSEEAIIAKEKEASVIRKMLDDRGIHDVEIEVDGGVNVETAAICRANGADVLVAGNAIFSSDDPKKTIELLRG